MATKQEIITELVKLNAAYPATKLDEANYDVFAESFESVDYEILKKAFKKARMTLKFFPSVAALNEIVQEFVELANIHKRPDNVYYFSGKPNFKEGLEIMRPILAKKGIEIPDDVQSIEKLVKLAAGKRAMQTETKPDDEIEIF